MNSNLVPNFDGLYGDLEIRYTSQYIFLETIANRSEFFDWIIKPHIHTHLFQVFIVENGSIVFQEAQQKRQIYAPCVILIPPAHLHGLSYTPDVEGYIFTISDSIVEDIFNSSIDIFKTFENIQIIEKNEDDNSFIDILTLIQALSNELFSDQTERTIMLKSLITQFFVNLHRQIKQVGFSNKDSRSLQYFRSFQKIIRTNPNTLSIAQIAHDLNITTVHLTRICREISGKSPLELLHQELISEAQKYLLHTSYSVSEIAYLLKFEYPNYFTRFFKKRVGVLPNEYRKKGEDAIAFYRN